MQNVIYLSKVLQEMERTDKDGKPVKFDLSVRRFNKKNKAGGKIHHYKGVCLLRGDKSKGGHSIESLMTKSKPKVRKNPNHYENKTRNLELPNGEKEKIHILLITKFNNKEVVY